MIVVEFCLCGASSWKLHLNGTAIEITEGKYPDDWRWTLWINDNTLEISVMKTVEFTIKLKPEDVLWMRFEGGLGDAFEHTEESNITIGHDSAGWHLIDVDDHPLRKIPKLSPWIPTLRHPVVFRRLASREAIRTMFERLDPFGCSSNQEEEAFGFCDRCRLSEKCGMMCEEFEDYCIPFVQNANQIMDRFESWSKRHPLAGPLVED